MTMIAQNSTTQPTPDGGGGVGVVVVAGLVAIAYFWEAIVWAFAAAYSAATAFIGDFWSWIIYAAQSVWSVIGFIVSFVYDLAAKFALAIFDGAKSAIAWSWPWLSGIVLEVWSVIAAIVILAWTAGTIALGGGGWPGGMAWDSFGLYLLFGLGTGIIVGTLQHVLRVRSRYVEEVIKAAGSPEVVTAARLGTVSVIYTVGLSLALSAALAAIGLVVPYLLGGMTTAIAPGGPLDMAVFLAGGFGGGGFGGGGFGGGGAPTLAGIIILCGLVILMGFLVGLIFSGVVSIFVSGIASAAAIVLKAGASHVGHSIGHIVGANLVYGMTKSFARAKRLTGQPPQSAKENQSRISAANWALHAMGSGVRAGVMIAVFFAIWLSTSLLLGENL